MFETTPALLRRHHLSLLGLVVIEHVAILRTSQAPRLRPGCASRHVAFRKTPSTGRCKCPVCRPATKCGSVVPAHCSSCGSTSAPRIRVEHPLTPAARTGACRLEYEFRWP